MSFVWLTASFCYYLILTLINTFDDVYVTALVSSFSEIAAYILSGLFFERIGVKLSLVLSFALSGLGGILILAWGLDHQSSTLFFIFFLFTKFGVTCAFNINFAANSYLFPTLFAATAIGVCNFAARFTSSFSFVVSRLEEPTPMYLLTGLCALTSLAAILLKTPKKEHRNKSQTK